MTWKDQTGSMWWSSQAPPSSSALSPQFSSPASFFSETYIVHFNCKNVNSIRHKYLTFHSSQVGPGTCIAPNTVGVKDVFGEWLPGETGIISKILTKGWKELMSRYKCLNTLLHNYRIAGLFTLYPSSSDKNKNYIIHTQNNVIFLLIEMYLICTLDIYFNIFYWNITWKDQAVWTVMRCFSSCVCHAIPRTWVQSQAHCARTALTLESCSLSSPVIYTVALTPTPTS